MVTNFPRGFLFNFFCQRKNNPFILAGKRNSNYRGLRLICAPGTWIFQIFIFVFQVLGSEEEFHFVHHALPNARSKRSIPHIRKLRSDKRVSTASTQSKTLTRTVSKYKGKHSKFICSGSEVSLSVVKFRKPRK